MSPQILAGKESGIKGVITVLAMALLLCWAIEMAPHAVAIS